MDYHDAKKSKKIIWSAPRKSNRPNDDPRAFKDLMLSTLARHGIGRQVTAGMIVERMNKFLTKTNPVLAKEVNVVSVRFGEVKIGLSHRLFQEQVKIHEDHLRIIASELTDESVRFRYTLMDKPGDGSEFA